MTPADLPVKRCPNCDNVTTAIVCNICGEPMPGHEWIAPKPIDVANAVLSVVLCAAMFSGFLG